MAIMLCDQIESQINKENLLLDNYADNIENFLRKTTDIESSLLEKAIAIANIRAAVNLSCEKILNSKNY